MDRADEANLTVTNIQYGINTLLLPKLKQLQDFDINAIIYNVGVNSECFDSTLWCFFVVCSDISIYSVGINSECFDTTFVVVVLFCFDINAVI